MAIYILTREHNEYEQHGEYLVAVFTYLPSTEQVQEVLVNDGAEYHEVGRWLNPQRVSWLIAEGGGRPDSSWDVWYWFREFISEEVDFTVYN